MSGVVLI